MPRSNYYGVQLPKLPRQLEQTVLDHLEDNHLLESLRIGTADFSSQEAGKLVAEQVIFQHVLFNLARFSAFRGLDCLFEVCDLSGSNWDKARFQRVLFKDCKLFNTQFLEANFENLLLQDCKADHAVFALAHFKAARMDKCSLKGASFVEADLRGMVFHECDLTGADLRNAKLEGVDFRTAIIDGIQVGPQDLKGVLIQPTQAVQVVGLLGVQVLDVDREGEPGWAG